MATKTAKKSNVQNRVDNLKATAANIHDEALEVSDKLVEGSLATGAKWQKIMAKALTHGTVLFEKQQDLTLSTLEEIKGHVTSANKRFKKLFSFDLPKRVKNSAPKKVAKAKAATKKVVKKTKTTAKALVKVKADVAKDNLKLVDGIGPKIQTLLNQAGISSFAQLAAANIKDLQVILEAAGPRFKAHDPKTWMMQAKRLMKK